MTTLAATPDLGLSGLQGRALSWLLQRRFVRYHRIQLGFVERPAEYEQFLATVVGPRLRAIEGRLGVFGVGVHTQIALKAMPWLGERIACFADNNASVWRQTRFDRTVLPPAEAAAACDAFFLSTAVFQRVLRRDLRRLHFRGVIVSVDDHVPPGWFLR
jgi:hypothetical protein